MLSISTLVISIFNFGYVLRAVGNTRIILAANLLRLLSTLILSWTGLHFYGLIGAATGVISSMIIGNIFIIIKVRSLVGLTIRNMFPFNELYLILAFSSLASAIMLLVKMYFPMDPLTTLVSTAAVFGLIYFISILKAGLVSKELRIIGAMLLHRPLRS